MSVHQTKPLTKQYRLYKICVVYDPNACKDEVKESNLNEHLHHGTVVLPDVSVKNVCFTKEDSPWCASSTIKWGSI